MGTRGAIINVCVEFDLDTIWQDDALGLLSVALGPTFTSRLSASFAAHAVEVLRMHGHAAVFAPLDATE
jgi:hypothetical protein